MGGILTGRVTELVAKRGDFDEDDYVTAIEHFESVCEEQDFEFWVGAGCRDSVPTRGVFAPDRWIRVTREMKPTTL